MPTHKAKSVSKQLALQTHNSYFSQISLFNGFSILLIIPWKQSLVSNNLSLLALCTWIANQGLSSATACVWYFYCKGRPGYWRGERLLASWGGGIQPLLFLLFWFGPSLGLACLRQKGRYLPCISHQMYKMWSGSVCFPTESSNSVCCAILKSAMFLSFEESWKKKEVQSFTSLITTVGVVRAWGERPTFGTVGKTTLGYLCSPWELLCVSASSVSNSSFLLMRSSGSRGWDPATHMRDPIQVPGCLIQLDPAPHLLQAFVEWVSGWNISLSLCVSLSHSNKTNTF